jgi:signal transduction histidine kinase
MPRRERGTLTAGPLRTERLRPGTFHATAAATTPRWHMDARIDNLPRMLATLERLLEIPVADLKTALSHASDALAAALDADKVDAFLYDETRDSLVAVGTSTQPLSSLQKRLGLDVLPISNGGRAVQVFQSGEAFLSADLLADPEELRGIKEGLRVQSQVGVPLAVGGERRGMIMVASLQPDFFTAADASFVRSSAHWVGLVAHRAQLLQDIERNALRQGRQSSAEELVTVLAHDLRNYFSPVVLRLHHLRHRAEAEARAADREDIEVALRGIARANSLVSDLLDVARLDEGLFRVRPEPVELAGLVHETAALLASAEHNVIVKAAMPIVVTADPSRLRQCVHNILDNALGHSPAGGTISVFIDQRTREGTNWGIVEVVDEGPGIPEDLLPSIFERFRSGRTESGGLGLGLHIAKRIALAHGGDVEADRCPGRGARFTVRIPAVHDSGLALQQRTARA